MTAELNYFYPDCMGWILLRAMDEILGPGGSNSVLKYAQVPEYIDRHIPCDRGLNFPFQHISQIQGALVSVYGSRGGLGLACRIGRASYKHILREFGPDLGLTSQEFRLLPLPDRLKTGIESLADLFNRFTDQHVRIERKENLVFWQVQNCPLCWDRQAIEPSCHLAVGLLQEALYWFSGGKYFQVEEKSCVACGDTECTIVIDPVPMN